MDWSGVLRGLVPTRSDLDASDVYERVLEEAMITMDGPNAAMSMPEPVFQRGLFMVIHSAGLLINSEWSAVEGGPRGYLRFGEIFAVVDVSPRYDGHYVSPHYEAGMVRVRVERHDSVWGYISVYDTRRMQHFVASIDGQPPLFRPRDLLRRLIHERQQPRLPLAVPPMLARYRQLNGLDVSGNSMRCQSCGALLERQSGGALHVHCMVFDSNEFYQRGPRYLAAPPLLGAPPLQIEADSTSIDDTSSEHPPDIQNFHDFLYAQIDGDFQMTVQYPGDSGV